jgi:hypothetical protein
MPTNVVWAWTACDEKNKRDAMTFWTHEFDDETMQSYRARPATVPPDPRLGFRERIRHLQFAREQCNGEVAVILVTVADPNASR